MTTPDNTTTTRLEYLTPTARTVMADGQTIADILQHTEITALHVLAAAIARFGVSIVSTSYSAKLMSEMSLALASRPKIVNDVPCISGALLVCLEQLQKQGASPNAPATLAKLLRVLGDAKTDPIQGVLRNAGVRLSDIPLSNDPNQSAQKNNGDTKSDSFTADDVIRRVDLPKWPLQARQGALHVSRKSLVEQALPVLANVANGVVVLVGPTGSGRTQLLRAICNEIGCAKNPLFKQATILEAAIDKMILKKIESESLQRFQVSLMQQILNLDEKERVQILLIDDFDLAAHDSSGRGTNLATDLLAALRPVVLRGLRVIFVASPQTVTTYFKSDSLWGHRSTFLYLGVLPREELESIVQLTHNQLTVESKVSLHPNAQKAILAAAETSDPLTAPGRVALIVQNSYHVAIERGLQEITEAEVITVCPQLQRVSDELELLRALQEKITKDIIGQDNAVESVCRRVQMARLQLDQKPERPDGVFLLAGPSGVGKTEMAKTIARALYGDLRQFIRFDMSEYGREHEYAKLIGSPSGYIDSEKGGLLTERIRQIGHGVLLLDEIEKAHVQVLMLFLQVFDDGILTDGRGQKADFSRFVILMTTNLGRELWGNENRRVGFSTTSSERTEPEPDVLRNALRQNLPSEFLNRVDDIVPFRALTTQDLLRITKKMVADEIKRWEHRNKKLTVSDELIEWLARTGYEPAFGARHLMRNVERELGQRISELVLSPKFENCHELQARLINGVPLVDATW